MINSIFDSLLQLLVLTPFAIIAGRGNKNAKAGFLIAASLLFIVTSVANDALANVTFFEGQQWNWAGKAASLLIALAFIFLYKPFTPRQYGLTAKIERAKARPILLIGTAYFLLRFILYFTSVKGPVVFHTETILFQATLPGMAEEIIFRGILLTLLNHVFTTPRWTIAKVSFGWAAILTSLLFGLTHGLYFDGGYHIQFDAFAVIRTAFDGFLFALLVERTKSLVPSIVLHNLLNLIGNH